MNSIMNRARIAKMIPTIPPSVRDLDFGSEVAPSGTINVGVDVTWTPRAPTAYERSVEYAIKYMVSKSRYTSHITGNIGLHITLLACMVLLQWCGSTITVHIAIYYVMQNCVWAKYKRASNRF